eukprot:TRINITY_DN70912_c0_g1_i1.p1 TRINITY_DN70912_c0_g1~~TRINITY_DN70912_c0_g1_i1.p1  ORF type:complete len:284 (-),score=46.44 TRINITY_DN70912_c0_g1_i1:239-1090(-)
MLSSKKSRSTCTIGFGKSSVQTLERWSTSCGSTARRSIVRTTSLKASEKAQAPKRSSHSQSQALLAVSRTCRECGCRLSPLEAALHKCTEALEWSYGGDVVAPGPGGDAGCRVVRLPAKLPPAARSRLEALWAFVRAELPHSLGDPPSDSDQLLLALHGRRVVGLLWAERVSMARLIEVDSMDASDDITESSAATSPEILQSTGGTPALGVALMWVRRSEQRKNIATTMVDAMRAQASSLGRGDVPLEQVAFSQPTTQGFAFAARYLHRVRGGKVLVYLPDWR